LKEEAAKADVVLHAADASDHEGAAKAIIEGLKSGHSKERPGYWLHTGGTGILTYQDSDAENLGEWSEKQYNDWDGVAELTGLPDHAFHRNVDKIVLDGTTKNSDVIKTALVCPPTIYGNGRGPVSGRGRQTYELAKFILDKQYVPIIGKGKARWNNIHVADLSDAYVLLTEAAVNGNQGEGIWGGDVYYLTENGEHVWGDLARHIAQRAKALGYTGELKEDSLSKDAALEAAGFEAVSWGWNSRGKAERAGKLLGWKPSRCSIEDEADEILKQEKSLLQSSK